MALVDDQDVAKYEARRYRGPDQKWIDRRERAWVARQLPEMNLVRARVLDAPCGYGRFALQIARHGAKVICADISAAMVGRARTNVADAGKTALCVVMDIRHLPFRTGAFEATLTMRLFHHGFARAEMAAILAELARVSRRWVILSYYRHHALHAWFRRLKGFSSRIRMLTDAEFEAELAGLPLRIHRREVALPLLHAQTLVVLEKTGAGRQEPGSEKR